MTGRSGTNPSAPFTTPLPSGSRSCLPVPAGGRDGRTQPGQESEPMSAPAKQRLELFIQVVIAYSLVTYFIEIEFTDTQHSTGFWLWSERVVAVIFTVEYAVRWIAS